MLNLSLQDLLIRLGAYLVVGLVFGLLANLVLRLLGGKAPAAAAGEGVGFAFFDLAGMLAAVLLKQGWARSPQPEPGGMKGRRIGLVAWVVITLALTLLAIALLRIGRPPIASLGNNVFTQAAISVINASGDIGIWFVIVSILPIPPLMGGNILLALFPGLRATARKFYWPGTAIVALLVGLGFVEAAFRPLWTVLRGWVIV